MLRIFYTTRQCVSPIVEEDTGALTLSFGSSYKTSDFIVDNLMNWWENTPADERATIAHIQLKVDNGSESSGVRTQFLQRMVEFADYTRKPI